MTDAEEVFKRAAHVKWPSINNAVELLLAGSVNADKGTVTGAFDYVENTDEDGRTIPLEYGDTPGEDGKLFNARQRGRNTIDLLSNAEVFATVKYDGTCVGKNIDGVVFGRNLKIGQFGYNKIGGGGLGKADTKYELRDVDGNGGGRYQRTPLTEVGAFDVNALRIALLEAIEKGAGRVLKSMEKGRER